MNDNNKKGLGIASITMALIGLIIFGLPLGIGAMVTGFIGWKDSDLAKVGSILGIIEVLVMLVYLSA